MSTKIHIAKPKNRNQFAALSEADRQLILNLCAAYPYEEAAELLRKPRSEGGLDIRTSASALCRYFTSHHPDSDRAVLAQIAAATNIRHEQDANAFLGAIRATVQARVLENLRSGRALADMEKDFKLLRTTESLYLADAKFRAIHPKTTRAAYQNLVQRCAEAPEADFLPNNDHQHSTESDDLTNSIATYSKPANAARKRSPSWKRAASIANNSPTISTTSTPPSSTCSPPPSRALPGTATFHLPPPQKPPPFHIFHQIPPPRTVNQHKLQPTTANPNPSHTLPHLKSAATIPAPAAAAANQKNAATPK